MEVWQTLEFIWDSQIEPFIEPLIELNMGLDYIIHRFRADFVRGLTGIRASRGYTLLPKTSFMCVRVCMCARTCACMCVCVHACASMHAPACVFCVRVCVCLMFYSAYQVGGIC